MVYGIWVSYRATTSSAQKTNERRQTGIKKCQGRKQQRAALGRCYCWLGERGVCRGMRDFGRFLGKSGGGKRCCCCLSGAFPFVYCCWKWICFNVFPFDFGNKSNKKHTWFLRFSTRIFGSFIWLARPGNGAKPHIQIIQINAMRFT